MRLNRFLAAAGFGSRRSCEELVRDGRVRINGHVVTNLATTVTPEDDVRVGSKVARTADPIYLLLHKPKGYVSTAADERGRKTVMDLLPPYFGRLFHVGRLDMESEGLILLTNDGDLAQKLTHPAHEVEKEYEVVLDKPFDYADSAKMLKGFVIEGGRARMESIRAFGPNKVKVILRQGIKRQIRLMFYKMGYEVERLVRTRIGALRMDNLKPGMWKQLTRREVSLLAPAPKARKTPKP